MKKFATYLSPLLILLALCSCHQDNDDYMTMAVISLDSGDTLTIDRVQAMAHITNLNTRHVVSTAEFNGKEVRVELLRGAYQINVEGILSCSDRKGSHRLRQFRAVSDYTELTGTGVSETKLGIMFLDD
jgi:hypothetical protein